MVIDNDKPYRYTDNDKDIVRGDPFYEDKTASWISEQLGADDEISLKYYRILAANLPKPLIDKLVGTARERATQSRPRYFCKISKIELEKYKYRKKWHG